MCRSANEGIDHASRAIRLRQRPVGRETNTADRRAAQERAAVQDWFIQAMELV
jgi:hypothetical protein